MRLLTAIRIRQLRAPRLVAAIFAIGWLGIAIAPCHAMPDLQQPATSHQGSMPAGDCGHCPSALSGHDNGCAMAAAPDCQSAGPLLLEHRDSAFPQPAIGSPLALPAFDAFIPDSGPMPDGRAHRLPVSRISIQQLYCTYLI